MLFYIICLDELIIRMKNNNQCECKTGGYADDIAGMLKSYECI